MEGGAGAPPEVQVGNRQVPYANLPQWRGEPGLPRSNRMLDSRSRSLLAAMEGGAGAPPERRPGRC